MVRRILSSLILLLPAQDYIFNTMSTYDGFPSKVNSVYVQQKGFAWVGTDDGTGCYKTVDNSYTTVESIFFKGAQTVLYDAKPFDTESMLSTIRTLLNKVEH